MLFHTFAFLVFFTVLIALLLIFRGFIQRKVILTVASYVFYMWWNPAFILLIAFSTVVDYVIGLVLDQAEDPLRRKLLVTLSICTQLGLLFYFKYFGFFASNLLLIERYLGFHPAWQIWTITLPVGISFYTFATLSYSIDIYRREIRATRSPLDFALFIAFFPHLVAGPIVRASQLLPQFKQPAPLRIDRPTVFLFLRGMAKKVIIADNVAVLANTVFADPARWPSTIIWLATIAFSVQIYCDFSGYSDMAIAIARVLGYKLPLNFRHPYFAVNPSDFWRRWHITLSSWLRDYLYIPLGGNRHGNARTYVNLTLTMLIGGLWHGASWNFVLWGLWHGVLLMAHRAWTQIRGTTGTATPPSRFGRIASQLAMGYCVLVSWIMFRITDFPKMLIALRKFVLFDMNFSLSDIGVGTISFFSTVLLIGIFATLHLWSYKKDGLDHYLGALPVRATLALTAAAGLALFLFWPLKEAPFIYFQF